MLVPPSELLLQTYPGGQGANQVSCHSMLDSNYKPPGAEGGSRPYSMPTLQQQWSEYHSQILHGWCPGKIFQAHAQVCHLLSGA